MKECEFELTQKGEMVERLQIKASSIGRILNNLEKKYTDAQERGEDPDFMKKSPSGQHITHQKRPQSKIQSIPPFNASKVRKSPSGTLLETTAEAQSEATSPAAVAVTAPEATINEE